jgi:hypothetical protein
VHTEGRSHTCSVVNKGKPHFLSAQIYGPPIVPCPRARLMGHSLRPFASPYGNVVPPPTSHASGKAPACFLTGEGWIQLGTFRSRHRTLRCDLYHDQEGAWHPELTPLRGRRLTKQAKLAAVKGTEICLKQQKRTLSKKISINITRESPGSDKGIPLEAIFTLMSR